MDDEKQIVNDGPTNDSNEVNEDIQVNQVNETNEVNQMNEVDQTNEANEVLVKEQNEAMDEAKEQIPPSPQPPKKTETPFLRGEQIPYLVEKMRGKDADPPLVNVIFCSDPICEEYLEFVARTGRPIFEWSVLKSLLIWRLECVLWEISQTGPFDHLQSVPNTDRSSARQYIERIITSTRLLPGVPFTIQRICELLIQPKKHYKRADRFYRALEKNISVVTTVDGDGRRETERQPEPDENEIGIGMGENCQNRFTPEKSAYNENHTPQ